MTIDRRSVLELGLVGAAAGSFPLAVAEIAAAQSSSNGKAPVMLKHVEMDARQKLADQFADPSDAPVILINLFDVDPRDADHFKRAWAEDATFFKRQPGYISAQLHHGIGNSSMWLNYAVFENAKMFGATTRQPEFGPLRGIYPDSATARPNLFRRVRIPGICVD